jgi:hypothetical protein
LESPSRGNQSARKHGLYSDHRDDDIREMFASLVEDEHEVNMLRREVALLRTRLNTTLRLEREQGEARADGV